jgi:hypothetical protein
VTYPPYQTLQLLMKSAHNVTPGLHEDMSCLLANSANGVGAGAGTA